LFQFRKETMLYWIVFISGLNDQSPVCMNDLMYKCRLHFLSIKTAKKGTWFNIKLFMWLQKLAYVCACGILAFASAISIHFVNYEQDLYIIQMTNYYKKRETFSKRITFMGKIATSVIFKMFINYYEICHQSAWAARIVQINLNNINFLVPEDQEI